MSSTETETVPTATPEAGGMVKVTRAILSAYDKSGLVPFAQTLADNGIEIISTGGTMRVLREAGIAVTPAEDITGFGSMLDGRVKTLHPNLLAGVLARHDNSRDREELEKAGIKPSQLVVVNLYPFAQAATDPNATLDDAIELIDVGGPTMIRAAAKNHNSVAVVCDPSDYEAVALELRENNGAISFATRQRLAVAAFSTTSAYDMRIAEYLGSRTQDDEIDSFPALIGQHRRVSELRYGENPHQRAAVYALADTSIPSLAHARVLSGKALSYNNYGDLDAAWRMAADFSEPFAAVFKHATPCGAAVGDTIRDAYVAAYETDPLSAYGSIIALNRRVDMACAEALHETTFVECVLAPGYDDDALALLKKKKARRFLEVPTMDLRSAIAQRYREIVGGFIIQDEDFAEVTPADLNVVTQKAPTDAEIASLLIARKIVKHAKSNAIAIIKGRAAVGIGSGQTSRVDAVKQAVERAGERAKGAVLASDAFFPMADGVEAAIAAGVTAILQPGGSKRDEDVIAACNAAGIAMVFSGVRNFRH